MNKKMKSIVVLVSGGGTNLERIIECTKNGNIPNAHISLVVADRECFGLKRAENHQIPSLLIKRGKDFCENLDKALPKDTDLIVCAGFLSIITPEFAEKYAGRIINIHPSLLPKFGGKGMWGMNVHKAVITAQETESGASVHWVTAGIDEGGIILQGKVSISKDETPESLAEKIHQVEYDIFPKAIAKVLAEQT